MPSQQHPQEQPSSGPSLLTLAIASASSVVAAILVSKIWGPGTIIGAAATPVIVTFVGELLKKPAEKVTVVRVAPTGTQVHERTAPTSPGSERVGGPSRGSDRGVPPSLPTTPGMAARSVHRSQRRPLFIALATGLAAFVIGAVVLTSSELVLGDTSVGSGNRRTTLIPGGTKERSRKENKERATPTTSTKVETTTVPVPTRPTTPTTTTPSPTTPTGTAPPAVPTDPAPTVPAPGTGPTAP